MEDITKKIYELREKLFKLIYQSKKILDPENVAQQINESYFDSYEPDSSPIAWQYYIDTYSRVFVLNEKSYNYCNETKSPYYYENNRSRICGNFSHKDTKLELLDNDHIQRNKSIGFAGDCCFNFNSNKIEKFHKIISADTDNIDKEKFLKLLNTAKKMHHSPLNFALMPINGGMNSTKGDGIWGLDRFDTFIAALDFYFVNKQNPISIKLIAEFETSQYTLLSFLKIFNTFDGYCKYFYPELSNNKKLLRKLIDSGKKPLKIYDDNGNLVTEATINRIIEYIELAIDFWKAKADYYDEQHKKHEQSTPLNAE